MCMCCFLDMHVGLTHCDLNVHSSTSLCHPSSICVVHDVELQICTLRLHTLRDKLYAVAAVAHFIISTIDDDNDAEPSRPNSTLFVHNGYRLSQQPRAVRKPATWCTAMS